jgi:sugar O-acyltransferase (sialic acid O-acetyltransferase NeuD family)
MKPLIIYGTGSMARLIHSFLRKEKKVSAFVADDAFVHGDTFMGLPLIPLSQFANRADVCRIVMAVGYHDMNEFRAKRFAEFQGLGHAMKGYVHHSLIHHNDVVLEKACVIYDNVAIHAGSVIHQNAFISSNVSIGHDCDIGAHAWINSGVSLAGGVKVGARCVLGINSCVAQGVTLGEGTFVGANTLVTQDTPPNSVIVSQQGEIMSIDSRRFIKMVGQP